MQMLLTSYSVYCIYLGTHCCILTFGILFPNDHIKNVRINKRNSPYQVSWYVASAYKIYIPYLAVQLCKKLYGIYNSGKVQFPFSVSHNISYLASALSDVRSPKPFLVYYHFLIVDLSESVTATELVPIGVLFPGDIDWYQALCVAV